MADNQSIAKSGLEFGRERDSHGREPEPNTAPTAHAIGATAGRMRASQSGASQKDMVHVVARTLAAWRERNFSLRRATVAAIATAWGYSEPLLDASFDALLEPFTDNALASFATNYFSQRPPDSRLIVGMIMPGNLPGAGIHEVLIALLSGVAVILKTSAAEPIFFASFARTLREFSGTVGERIAVFNWSRDRADLTRALCTDCDWLAAFGGDDTLASLAVANDLSAGKTRGNGRISSSTLKAGFGLRFSGAYVSMDAATGPDRVETAQALARDISLFEQAGCLSPHHVFVEDEGDSAQAKSIECPIATARTFAAELAAALDCLAGAVPPPRRLGLEAAAGVRRARETARWRGLGGEPVRLWEGRGLGWTVIYDEKAQFTPSPGFRTVTVSPVTHPGDLAHRLEPVAGRIEAFALAGASEPLGRVRQCLIERGASWLCAPGAMQSPPLNWRHGGGIFLDTLLNE